MPSIDVKYDSEKVLVGQARMFVAPYSATNPVVLPDENTVPLNGDWTEGDTLPWVGLGATAEGMMFNFQRSTNAVGIEEQITPVFRNTESVEFNISTVLSQDTLETMKYAMGGGTITETTAGTGQIGKRRLVLSSNLEPLTFGFEGVAPTGYWRRVLIPKVTSEGQVEAAYRRAADARRYATQFNALVPLEDVIIDEMTAEATG